MLKIAPIILRSKLNIVPNWIREKFMGNKTEAVKKILENIKENIEKFNTVFISELNKRGKNLLKKITNLRIDDYIQLKNIILDETKNSQSKLREFFRKLNGKKINFPDDAKNKITEALKDEFRILYLIYWFLYKLIIYKKYKKD